MSYPIMESTSPMLEPEILARLSNDEDPLDLSIEKYERLLNRIMSCQYVDNAWLYAGNCPLCHEYNCLDNNGISNKSCPLEIYGNYCNAENSIWHKLISAIKYGDNNQEDLCKVMIKRLKQIRDIINNGV